MPEGKIPVPLYQARLIRVPGAASAQRVARQVHLLPPRPAARLCCGLRALRGNVVCGLLVEWVEWPDPTPPSGPCGPRCFHVCDGRSVPRRKRYDTIRLLSYCGPTPRRARARAARKARQGLYQGCVSRVSRKHGEHSLRQSSAQDTSAHLNRFSRTYGTAKQRGLMQCSHTVSGNCVVTGTT